MRLPGLEPGTSTLSVLRSNQLSYRRVFGVLIYLSMEARRLELLALCLQSRCSTN